MTTDRHYHDSKQIDGIKLKIYMFMEFVFCTGIRLVNEKLVLCQYFTRFGVCYDPKEGKATNV